jgi:hypothetical protein
MRFRITPEGESGWIVEEERLTEFTCTLFGLISWRKFHQTWRRVWLYEKPNGQMVVSQNPFSSYHLRPVGWPETKEEIKKILDPIISRHILEEYEKEAREKRIADRLKNNPPEEYP